MPWYGFRHALWMLNVRRPRSLHDVWRAALPWWLARRVLPCPAFTIEGPTPALGYPEGSQFRGRPSLRLLIDGEGDFEYDPRSWGRFFWADEPIVLPWDLKYRRDIKRALADRARGRS